MSYSANDVVPIRENSARLTALSDDVVGGAEKLLTKNGAAYVSFVDTKKLDYYHALDEEHAGLVLLADTEIGLREILERGHPPDGWKQLVAECQRTYPNSIGNASA